MFWISILVVAGLHRTPSYTRYRLHELVALADQVVVGTIQGLAESTFDLQVEKTLVGNAQASLRVPKFQNWMCASRYAPYRDGQRVLLLLKDGHVMGGGDEGEWPLLGDGVLVPYFVRGSRLVERPIDGGAIGASWVPLADIEQSLAPYRSSFEFHPEKDSHLLQIGGTRMKLLAEERSASVEASPFGRELCEDTLRCFCFRGAKALPEEPPVVDVISARRQQLDRLLGLFTDDGVEVQSRFAQALLARVDDGLQVLASDPASHSLTQLTLHPQNGCTKLGATMSEDERLRYSWDAPEFGASLAGLGDLDGDGVDELAVGAPRGFYLKHSDHQGLVHILSWTAGTPLRPMSRIRASRAPAELVDGCSFGHALCAPGDLDGDGRSELVVARKPDGVYSPEQSRYVQAPGSLAVLFLDSRGDVTRWNAIEARRVGHEGPTDFGAVLAAPGDVDGDGVPDLVLGEPLDSGGGTYRGALRVLFLTAAGEVRAWKRIDSSTSAALALEDGDEFGAVLAAPGDLDGDGVPELVIGGARALWSVALERDGTVRSARRQTLASLIPEAVQPISLARVKTDADSASLLLAATFGSWKPLDVGLTRLRADRSGLRKSD